jgi:hypothetical protein
MSDLDLDPVQLLADNIRLRCERDAANRDYATMLATLTAAQEVATRHEALAREAREAHRALDHVAPVTDDEGRPLTLVERQLLASGDVLVEAVGEEERTS